MCTRRRSSSGMPPGRRTVARITCSHWSNVSGCVSRPPPAPFPAAALPPPSPPPLPENDGGFNVKRRRASSAASGKRKMHTSIARRSNHTCVVDKTQRLGYSIFWDSIIRINLGIRDLRKYRWSSKSNHQ